jgi:hypothetical protein
MQVQSSKGHTQRHKQRLDKYIEKIKELVTMELQKKELKAVYDTAQSFYKKAYYTKEQIHFIGGEYLKIKLYSYNTKVMELWYNLEEKNLDFYLDKDNEQNKNFYSKTTIRHIKELLKQFTTLYNGKIRTLGNKNEIISYNIEILKDASKKQLFELANHIEL